MSRIIFDPVAETHLLQHLEIVFGADAESLRFEQFVLRFQDFDSVFQLGPDRLQRAIQFVGRRHELFRWKKCDHTERFMGVTSQRIEAGDGIDFVAKKFQANCLFVRRGGIDFDHVAADPKFAARETDIVAFVEHIDQPT